MVEQLVMDARKEIFGSVEIPLQDFLSNTDVKNLVNATLMDIVDATGLDDENLMMGADMLLEQTNATDVLEFAKQQIDQVSFEQVFNSLEDILDVEKDQGTENGVFDGIFGIFSYFGQDRKGSRPRP
jgi:hypothetical protein